MKDRERDRFGAEELAVVLSHYDLGVIESITEFNRGSRKSPKVGVVSRHGKFLLKRRAMERRSDRRVTLAHAVQKRLEERGFPLARLIPLRDGNETCVHRGAEIYELFEFVRGEHYDHNPVQTRAAGAALAQFHQATAGMRVAADAPSGSYHDVLGVRTSLNALPTAIWGHDSAAGLESELMLLVHALFETYDRAADAVNKLNFASRPSQVVHGDWHPGNMLYDHDEVAAVLDYDSCRIGPRLVDVANGALQFSMTGGAELTDWPDALDEDRFAEFLRGYGATIELDDAERESVPHLMIEALIAEAVLPIAHTGSFGRFTGFGALKMVGRKSSWLAEHVKRMIDLQGGPSL